ncbi:MAG TPA: divalent-cation tolerance protein CutA [Myxococcota bacterium]|nr:divalent-cation tolerance protein CutA [Myxococcota bacterium]
MSPSEGVGAAAVQVVLVTVPDAQVAGRLARALVEERLAACVNLVPGIRSIYRWAGAVQEEEEVLLVIKTREDRVEALSQRVHELHPYEVPELIAVGVFGGSERYLAWLREEAAP